MPKPKTQPKPVKYTVTFQSERERDNCLTFLDNLDARRGGFEATGIRRNGTPQKHLVSVVAMNDEDVSTLNILTAAIAEAEIVTEPKAGA